jgi:hypothetical protein
MPDITRDPISDSRFYMWRALFAIAHADEVVTNEEKAFMHRMLLEQPFSPAQRNILTIDIEQKQDICVLFSKVTDQQDRSDFFHFARTLVWSDGDFGEQEQEVILRLKKIHVQSADLGILTDGQNLELENGSKKIRRSGAAEPQKKAGFLARFLGWK